jgi:hypothetical protein
MSMKNSNDTIGNRTHYLPACSAVPQPIAQHNKNKHDLLIVGSVAVVVTVWKMTRLILVKTQLIKSTQLKPCS